MAGENDGNKAWPEGQGRRCRAAGSWLRAASTHPCHEYRSLNAGSALFVLKRVERGHSGLHCVRGRHKRAGAGPHVKACPRALPSEKAPRLLQGAQAPANGSGVTNLGVGLAIGCAAGH